MNPRSDFSSLICSVRVFQHKRIKQIHFSNIWESVKDDDPELKALSLNELLNKGVSIRFSGKLFFFLSRSKPDARINVQGLRGIICRHCLSCAVVGRFLTLSFLVDLLQVTTR